MLRHEDIGGSRCTRTPGRRTPRALYRSPASWLTVRQGFRALDSGYRHTGPIGDNESDQLGPGVLARGAR
jgi:hypothetical protein